MEKLESGMSYKLTDLFKDNRHIIIPDLQRDYCWGDSKHGEIKTELVSGFIESLKSIFDEKNKKSIKLGMIYAYEYPENSNRIFLCDGQQRITTLFLLLGMINKYIEGDKIKHFLISEDELEDDQEPRLLYAIRESTLYFLSDLVCNFFLNNKETKVSEIKSKSLSWYFNEYNLDPTIQSMISAMEVIESKLPEITDLNEFSNFLLNQIEFFYFDMKDRETGEDMFVVINTTGEPLTATENIKPILIGNIENNEEQKLSSDIWEKWENWFWLNKLDSEQEADQGLNAFFVYYWQIKLLQEKQWKNKKSSDINPFNLFNNNSVIEANEESESSIKIEILKNAQSILEIDIYFKAYQNLFLDFKLKENQDVLNSITAVNYKKSDFLRQIPLNIILPLIQFKIKFPDELITTFLRRLRKNHFDGHKDWSERKENHIDWRHLIQIINESKNVEHLFSFSDDTICKKIANVSNNIKKWFNEEEKIKSLLKQANKSLIEEWEDHQDFMGDLSFLFYVFKLKNEGIENQYLELNKELNFIKFNSLDYEYLKTISIHQLQQCYETYLNIKNNQLLSVLKTRFSRVTNLWIGNWSFGREYFEYRRWHEKPVKLIYQNWIYFIMTNLIEKETDLDTELDNYIKALFSQIEKPYFETNLTFGKQYNFSEIIELIEKKATYENNNAYYFWNGLLWRYILAKNNPNTNIDFEIIFDLFDRTKDKYKVENQFIWSKGYYDKSIKIHDTLYYADWIYWKDIENNEEQLKNKFLENRYKKISELF